MKKIMVMALLLASAAGLAETKKDYQMGIYVTARAVEDGTLTNTVHGDGTTIAGDVYRNSVVLYKVKVVDGVWEFETSTQAGDATLRRMGMTPLHFKREKANPLDLLKNGDRVLFRVEQHRKIGGTETDVFIPIADQPEKEFRFVGRFISNTPPTVTQKASDNVKAMCESHKLSPEQEKQFCGEPTPTVAPTLVSEPVDPLSEADTNSAASIALMPCDQIKSMLLPSMQMVRTQLPKTWAAIQAKCALSN